MKLALFKPLALLSALMMTIGLAGCNTIEGFGKDLKKVGEKIEKKADEITDD